MDTYTGGSILRHHLLATAAFLGALVLGCASAPESTGPAWLADCRAYWATPDEPVLCGVGSAGYSRDHRLLERSAKRRAREMIGKTLRSRLRPILQSADGTTARHAASTLESIIDGSLKSSEVVATFETDLPSAYVLAAVGVEAIRDSIDAEKSLSNSLRQALTSAIEPSS